MTKKPTHGLGAKNDANVAAPVTLSVDEKVAAPLTLSVAEQVVAPVTLRVVEHVAAAPTLSVDEQVTAPEAVTALNAEVPVNEGLARLAFAANAPST